MNVRLFVLASTLIVSLATACGPTDGGGCVEKFTDDEATAEIEVICDAAEPGAQSYQCTCTSLDGAVPQSEFVSSEFCTSTRNFDSVKETCGF
jgi:hypothetical protein